MSEEAFIMAELYIKGLKAEHTWKEPTLTYFKGLEDCLAKLKNIYKPPRKHKQEPIYWGPASSTGWGHPKKQQLQGGWSVGSKEWEQGLPPPKTKNEETEKETEEEPKNEETKKEDAPKES